MGSYFFGFIISTLSLFHYNNSDISAGILACLLSYPCIEISVTFIRRLNIKQNPLKPDNLHLHNIIYPYILKRMTFGANSLTGIIILFIFSFPGLILYLLLNSTFHNYFWYAFISQIIIYFCIYSLLTKINKNLIST